MGETLTALTVEKDQCDKSISRKKFNDAIEKAEIS